MDHATAQIIAKDCAPQLIVDPFNPALPETLIVRNRANGHPFNIHLPTVPSNSSLSAAEAAEAEQSTLRQSLDTALKVLT